MESCLTGERIMSAGLHFARLISLMLFLSLANCRLWNTETEIKATIGGSLKLSCGNYCKVNGCSCRSQDWLWTKGNQDISPVKKISNLIQKRAKHGQIIQNSLCYGHRPRTNRTSDFGILISPIFLDDDGLTICCNTGEILFGTPQIQCTSISLKPLNTSIVSDKRLVVFLYWMAGISIVIVLILVGIGFIAWRMKLLTRTEDKKIDNRPTRRYGDPVPPGPPATNLWQHSASITSMGSYLTPIIRPEDPSPSEESNYQEIQQSRSDETLIKRSHSYPSLPLRSNGGKYTGIQCV